MLFRSLKSALGNEGVSYVTDKYDSLYKAWQLFQDWYRVRTDPSMLPQVKDLTFNWGKQSVFKCIRQFDSYLISSRISFTDFYIAG